MLTELDIKVIQVQGTYIPADHLLDKYGTTCPSMTSSSFLPTVLQLDLYTTVTDVTVELILIPDSEDDTVTCEDLVHNDHLIVYNNEGPLASSGFFGKHRVCAFLKQIQKYSTHQRCFFHCLSDNSFEHVTLHFRHPQQNTKLCEAKIYSGLKPV